MVRRTERILENIPVGSLGLISLAGCEDLEKTWMIPCILAS